jgi:hypothetical protein
VKSGAPDNLLIGETFSGEKHNSCSLPDASGYRGFLTQQFFELIYVV